MRVYFAALLVLLVAAGLAAAIQHDPGYILLAYGHTTVEMTLWVGVAVLTVLLVLAVALFIGLRRGARFSDWLMHFWGDRRLRRGRSKTTLGLIAFIEGNWAKARRLLIEAAGETDAPLVNYLLAARASHALGESKATRRYLALAEETSSRAGIAVELTQSELLLDNGQLEEALATLTRVRRNAERHPSVLLLLERVYIGLKDWTALLALVPDLRKHQLHSDSELAALERQALLGELTKAAQKAELQSWWKSLSKTQQRDVALLQAYCQQLLASGDDASAESAVRNALKSLWSDDLAALYGRIDADSARQLATAESWLRDQPGNVALLLTLARICLRNELWGKAREYLETAYETGRNLEVGLELGRLLINLGEPELGMKYTREALESYSDILPALPQPRKNL